MAGKTIYDKIWDAHVVEEAADGTCLFYIDRHLVHEVTSPQAFEALADNGYPVRRPEKTLAVMDHNTPTRDIERPASNPESAIQLAALAANAKKHGIELHKLGTKYNGVCHVMAPDLGFSLPGATLVCGDSHTATHGAFGAIAFGIGTSEVASVLGAQTIVQKKSKNMRIAVSGALPKYSTGKDVILYIIGKIGTAGGTGYAIEFSGPVFEAMSMEERMSVSNMAVEAGARVGIIAPDEKTFAYIAGKPLAPKGEMWERAVEYWRTLATDTDAVFDKEFSFAGEDIAPQVSWGTSPEDVIAIDELVPAAANESKARALSYMNLRAGQTIGGVKVDRVFIGSCTNGRIEDLRAAAEVLRGRRVAEGVKAMVVPGSNFVKLRAEAEGLDRIFVDAGFEWRWAGCSMCLAMNDDRAGAGERVASTSNRNFEGRQGAGAMTHLMSPAMAAAAAVAGAIADVRKLMKEEK